MLTATPLGATTGFSCSTGGVCVGTTADIQRLFFDLQREANRVAAVFGITSRISNDGKIGRQTVGLLIQIAQRAAARGPLDPALDNVLIEEQTRDVAAEALAIVAALKRNGAAPPTTWGPVASIVDFVGGIVRAGQGAPASLPPSPTGTPAVPSSTTTAVPINPYAIVPSPVAPAAGPPIVISTPWATWQPWQVAVGVGGGLVLLGTILAIALAPRRGLGCSCR